MDRRDPGIDADLDRGEELLRHSRESRRWNMRRRRSTAAGDPDRDESALHRLEEGVAQVRAIARTVGDSVSDAEQWDPRFREPWLALLREVGQRMTDPHAGMADLVPRIDDLVRDLSHEDLPGLLWTVYGDLLVSVRTSSGSSTTSPPSAPDDAATVTSTRRDRHLGCPRASPRRQTAGMSDIEALERILAERWSCRGYLPEPVDDVTVERLLEVARRTPSWCNTQPWDVHVLSGGAARALSAAMLASLEHGGSDLDFPQAYTGVHRERRRESGWQLYDAVGIVKGDRDRSFLEGLRNFELFGAPHVAIVTSPRELGTYGAIDCGLYVQTFLLAAQALGLGACAQAALAGQSPLLHEHLDIPEDRAVVCGISFGRPDPDHPTASYRTSRAPLTETVTRRG